MSKRSQEYLDALLESCPYFNDQLPKAIELTSSVLAACKGLFNKPQTAENLAKFMNSYINAGLEAKKDELYAQVKDKKITFARASKTAKAARLATEDALKIVEGIKLYAQTRADGATIFHYPEYVIFAMKLSIDPLISMRLGLTEPKTVWEFLLCEPAFFLPLNRK